MANCNYQLISTNKVGNVMHCTDCSELMIGIGTLILKFKEDQSAIFLKALRSTQKNYFRDKNPITDKVFLKTPVNNLMIALNEQELNHSIELLEFALLRIEVERLVAV